MAFWGQLYNQGDNNVSPDSIHTIPYGMYGMIVNRHMHQTYYNTSSKYPTDYNIEGNPSHQKFQYYQDRYIWEDVDKAGHGFVINWNRITKRRK